jgi:hypothetical protein
MEPLRKTARPERTLFTRLKFLAIRYDAAFIILHHTTKGVDPQHPDAIMGAAAIRNASRCAIATIRMDEEGAKQKYKIPPSLAHNLLRLHIGKLNYAKRPEDEEWYQFVSVKLNNGDGEYYKNGDSVGVLEPVDLSTLRAKLLAVNSNRIHENIALHVIANARPDTLLGMSKSGNTKRNVHDHVKKTLKEHPAGIAIKPEDLDYTVDKLIKDFRRKGFIKETSFQDKFRHNKDDGLKLTEAGVKHMNETDNKEVELDPSIGLKLDGNKIT